MQVVGIGLRVLGLGSAHRGGGGFPKLGVPFLMVLLIRAIVFWGLY